MQGHVHAYTALVYIRDGQIIAENSGGRVIARGDAAGDAAGIIQAGLGEAFPSG